MNCIGRNCLLVACQQKSIHESVGVRTALHHAARKRGLNPETMDPWYFPTIEEYRTVS